MSYQTDIAGLKKCYIPPATGRSLRLRSSPSTLTIRSNTSAKAKVLASTASSMSGTCCFHSTVISAAERESAYVIDGLMHNDVVKSDIHSTDTHGYSEMIFGTMHLLGFSYAPRIKNLKRQRLYTFKSRMGWDRAHPKSPLLAISTLRSSKKTGTIFSDSLQPSNSRRPPPRRSSGGSTPTPNSMPSTER